MKKASILFLTLMIGLSFTASATHNFALVITDRAPEIKNKEVDKKIDIRAFMKEVSLLYQTQRRKTAHIAIATFESSGKINGQYAQHTISSGHVIYKGEVEDIAKMALYSFVPEKTNKSWRRHEWLENSKRNRKERTDLPMNGGVGLNSYQYFDMVGPLSTYSEKYNYQLKAVEMIENEQVYRIRFNTKASFSLISRFTKGYLVVSVATKKLLRVDVSGELLWSSMFHERVFGTMHFEYVYYYEQPFISAISTRYEKKKVEERTLLKIDRQNFEAFIVEQQSVFDIQLLEQNPIVVADKNLFSKAGMGIDFKQLEDELGFEESLWEQNLKSSGKKFWRYQDGHSENKSGRENATKLIDEYKVFFASSF